MRGRRFTPAQEIMMQNFAMEGINGTNGGSHALVPASQQKQKVSRGPKYPLPTTETSRKQSGHS